MIRAVIFDLDGVLRHFDPQHVVSIERHHGLNAGSIHAAAFSSALLTAVTTGEISRAVWVTRVGELVRNRRAAAAWGAHPSAVDREMLSLVDEVKSVGVRTAILTNGTDTIGAELGELGIDSRVDAVFNSADIGFAKPDLRAFQHVLDALSLAPREVFFTDDSASKLTGAHALGMLTHHFVGIVGLREALRAVGVAVG